MDADRLKTLLADLHRELDHATGLDPDARRLVEQVRADITRLGGTPAGSAELEAGVTTRLQQAVLHFETGHPRLAAALGEFADALGRLGI